MVRNTISHWLIITWGDFGGVEYMLLKKALHVSLIYFCDDAISPSTFLSDVTITLVFFSLITLKNFLVQELPFSIHLILDIVHIPFDFMSLSLDIGPIMN
jgi:hypothetical protein